jgi:hypothetical protein
MLTKTLYIDNDKHMIMTLWKVVNVNENYANHDETSF